MIPNYRKLKNHQSGVVLVFVLLLLMLLTTMAGSFSHSMRGDASLVHHIKMRMEQNALADAGFVYAKFMLTQPLPAMRWRGDGRTYPFIFDGTEMEISIQDEGGKFNLNTVDKALLLHLLESLLEVDDQPLKLADAILDWRDADDIEREYGAESSDSGGGQAYIAANRPFKNLRELTQVKGIDQKIYGKLRPYLTVQGQQKKVDLSVAPEQLLNILPASSPAWVQEILMTRVSDPQLVTSLLVPQGMTKYASSSPSLRGQYLSITVNQRSKNKISRQVLVSRNVRGFYPVFSEIERDFRFAP